MIVALAIALVLLLFFLSMLVSAVCSNVGRLADAIEAQNAHYGIASAEAVVEQLERERAA